MNPLHWLERQIFLGEVIRDYGYIENRYNVSTRIYLVRRRNELCLMIKQSGAIPGLGTRYYHIRPNCFPVATDGVGPINWPKVMVFFLTLTIIVFSELIARQAI